METRGPGGPSHNKRTSAQGGEADRKRDLLIPALPSLCPDRQGSLLSLEGTLSDESRKVSVYWPPDEDTAVVSAMIWFRGGGSGIERWNDE